MRIAADALAGDPLLAFPSEKIPELARIETFEEFVSRLRIGENEPSAHA